MSNYFLKTVFKSHFFFCLLSLFFQSKVEDLSALDVLSGDFVAPTKASGVQAQAALSTKKTPEVKLLV